jgi:hypothetical protein
MSVDGWTADAVLKDHFRCPDEYDVFRSSGPLLSDPGFFRFGKGAVCYGRNARGHRPKSFRVADDLYDALAETVAHNGKVALPFDPNEAIENLRWERYIPADKGTLWSIIQKPYYLFRPFMSVSFRKHFQRAYLKRWRRIAFPRWPVDTTVENIFEQLVLLSLESRHERQMPFVWFWPEGYSGCLILTHDIETAAGRDFSHKLADIDAEFGMKSSFQIVPEKSYEVTPDFLQSLRGRGAEINLHGLTHDGQLFRNRRRFLQQAERINRYAKEYGAAGFRSPVLYRNLKWYADMNLSYDMSVPNVAHLDPQRGGCCTVMPYFVGDMLELPLTMIQDYTLFNLLGERSIKLWKQQIDLVLEKHGLLSFNVHPDYVMSEPYCSLYRELLQHLLQVCLDHNVWIALPGEVDGWWRLRRQMEVAIDQRQSPCLAAPHTEQGVMAWAHAEAGGIAYAVPRSKTAILSRSAMRHVFSFSGVSR